MPPIRFGILKELIWRRGCPPAGEDSFAIPWIRPCVPHFNGDLCTGCLAPHRRGIGPALDVW
jgi:hypothetical protein